MAIPVDPRRQPIQMLLREFAFRCGAEGAREVPNLKGIPLDDIIGGISHQIEKTNRMRGRQQ